MAKVKPSIFLVCNNFYNPNGNKCKGELIDVGPEGGGRNKTRLRCRSCSRVVHIQRAELEQLLEQKKKRASDSD